MDCKELGYPICEPGGKPFLYLTGTIVHRHRTQTNQETHMRPIEGAWRPAHVLIDKQSGELLIWCEKLTFRFRAIGVDAKTKYDIECVGKVGRVILDCRSASIIRCIESQVDGNLRKYPPIEHKNKKKQS